MKSDDKKAVRFFLSVVFLCAAVLVAASPISCRLTENGITLVTSDITAPVVLSFAVSDATTLSMSYSEPVTLENVCIVQVEADAASGDSAVAEASELLAVGSASSETAIATKIAYQQAGETVQLTLATPTAIGQRYCFSCTVKDYSGNTLLYSRYFIGYNDHPARLLLSEVRLGHSAANAKARRAEFIELYVLDGGNTAGIALAAGYYASSYELPVMEVSAGEYITVHTRTYYDDSVDELGANLAEPQSSPDASVTGRDLWIRGDASFCTKTDVIVLQNTADDSLLDALLLRENETKTAWTRTRQKELAAKAYECHLWPSGATPNEAVSGVSAVTKSLSRQNIATLAADSADGGIIAVTAEDWRVVTKCTPGAANVSE